MNPAAHDVVSGSVVGSGVIAGCRAANDAGRIDGFPADGNRRAEARRDGVGLVVRIAREHGVLIVEAVIDTNIGRLVVLRAQVRVREIIG